MDDYRPISLVGCIYKIISKILAKRVKSVVPKIIGSSRSTFIKGRGLLDNNEIVEECRLRRKRMLIVNAHYEKAYNSIIWDF